MPAYTWVLSLVTILGTIAAVAVAVHAAARRPGLTAAVAGTLLGWTLIVAVLAQRDVLVSGRVPWIGVVIAVAVAGPLAAARLPAVRAVLDDPATLARLAVPHAFRPLAGVMFLLLLAADRLPAAFALPAGIGDIAVGVAAPFVARRLARDPRGRAVAFQVLGALDLVVAVTMGFAVSPGPYQLIHVSPDGSLLGTLPVSLVPTAGVPLVFVLHVLSLRSRRPSVQAGPSLSGRQGRSLGHQAGTARR